MNSLMNTSKTMRVLALAVAGVLAACSSTPTRVATLEEARSAVAEAEQTPGAGESAAQEIDAAHTALRNADELAARHASIDDINHAAYLAQRHAQIALQQIATAQSKQIVKNGESERQRALLEAREHEAAQAASRNAAAAANANQEAQQANQQVEELQKQLADLHAKQTERGMVLTLGDVLFDTGKATLKPGAQSTLDRLAAFMRQSPDSSVVIEGHTDSVGSEEYNLDLSQQRAEAVRSALVSRNVDANRVAAVGKGKSEPVAGNNTAAGRQQNRRVEIVIQNAANRQTERNANVG